MNIAAFQNTKLLDKTKTLRFTTKNSGQKLLISGAAIYTLVASGDGGENGDGKSGQWDFKIGAAYLKINEASSTDKYVFSDGTTMDMGATVPKFTSQTLDAEGTKLAGTDANDRFVINDESYGGGTKTDTDTKIDGGGGENVLDLSSYGRFGIGYDGAYEPETSTTVERARLTFNASGTADNGLTFLSHIRHVIGTKNDDVIKGNGDSNILVGGAGDDQIDGRGGKDYLFGEAGDDVFAGQDSNDVYGGVGFDLIKMADGSDFKFSVDLNHKFIIAAEYKSGLATGNKFSLNSVEKIELKDTNGATQTTDVKNLYYDLDDVSKALFADGDASFQEWLADDDIYNYEAYDYSVGGGGANFKIEGAYFKEKAGETDFRFSTGTAAESGYGVATFGSIQLGSNPQVDGTQSNDRFIIIDKITDVSLNGLGGHNLLDFSGAVGYVDLNMGFAPAQGQTEVRTRIHFDYSGTSDSGLSFAYGFDHAIGSAHNDRMDGNNNANVLNGGDGNDDVFGQGGNDFLYGGRGIDFMGGGFGDDIMYGGDGNDNMGAGEGNDKLYGGNGDDTFTEATSGSYNGINYADGGAGIDTLELGVGVGYDYDFDLSGGKIRIAEQSGGVDTGLYWDIHAVEKITNAFSGDPATEIKDIWGDIGMTEQNKFSGGETEFDAWLINGFDGSF